MSKDRELNRARDLLKQKKYEQAYGILIKLDHPMAEQWVQQVSLKLSQTHDSLEGLRVSSPIGDDGLADAGVISEMGAKDMGGANIITGLMVGLILAPLMTFLGIGAYHLLELAELSYELVIFPLVLSTVAGLALALVMGIFRVRGPLITFALVVFAAFMSYGAFRYAGYLEAMQDPLVSEFVTEVTGGDDFLSYLQFAALDGQEVPRGQAIELFDQFAPRMDTDTTWLYWGFELLIILLMPWVITSGMRKRPTPALAEI